MFLACLAAYTNILRTSMSTTCITSQTLVWDIRVSRVTLLYVHIVL